MRRRCVLPWSEVNFFERMLYGLRHTGGHAALLTLRLGQQTQGSAPTWMLWVAEGR